MNLVVLTRQFGNYTGATISTIELLKRVNKKFDHIIVLTFKTDGTQIKNVKVVKLKSFISLCKLLLVLRRRDDYVGYSDDHLGFLLGGEKIKYVHTYHGNWPDAKKINFNMALKSILFIPMYKATIRNASMVVSVSKYMQKNFVSHFNDKNVVIYNGVKQNYSKHLKRKDRSRHYIMVGNVDKRKYFKAIELFKILQHKKFNGEIDIYGKIVDSKIAAQLKCFNFVNLKGETHLINYGPYDALICTSTSENLPVSIVESIINSVPVLAYSVGGIPEVVNEKTGRLFKFNESNDFSNAIVNSEFKTVLCNRKIKTIFNWDNSARRYEKVFSEVERKMLVHL